MDLFLTRISKTYCPVIKQFAPYYWSLIQVEYATDLVFRRQKIEHRDGTPIRVRLRPCENRFLALLICELVRD